MAKLINFRCPENLEADIARIGLEFYPKENDRGYDLTATMLAILQTGIDSITSQGLCLTERNTASLTSHKTEDITELRNAISEIHSRLESLENVSHKEQEPEKMELTQPEMLPILDAIATFPSQFQKDSPDDAPITAKTDNKEEIPINLIKELEVTVNPLLDGFEVNQATECPFIVGRSYTQQELKILFKTDYGSDIINWIEKKKGSKNPIAQKYSRCFTAKGVGKDKIYVFEGE